MASETEPVRRRTQDERRTTTHRAILDAAAERLVEAGLDGVTIAAVAKTAGVSSGAVLHHFKNKVQLILALTTHLSDAAKDDVVHAADPGAPVDERVAQMVDTMLAAVFDPITRAQFELHTAARVDPSLAEQLMVLNASNARTYVEDLALALIEAQVDPLRVLAAMELAVCAAVGLSLLSLSGRDPAIEARMGDSLKAYLLREIALAADGA